jgi:hypothetical protein
MNKPLTSIDGGNPYKKGRHVSRITALITGAACLVACTSAPETTSTPSSSAAPSHSKEVFPKENAPNDCEWIAYHEQRIEPTPFIQPIQPAQIPVLLGNEGAEQQEKLWAEFTDQAKADIESAKALGYVSFFVDAGAGVNSNRNSEQGWELANQIEELASGYFGVKKDPGNTTVYKVHDNYDGASVWIDAYPLLPKGTNGTCDLA